MMTTTTTTTMALVTRREDKRHVALGDATVAFFLALQEFSPRKDDYHHNRNEAVHLSAFQIRRAIVTESVEGFP